MDMGSFAVKQKSASSHQNTTYGGPNFREHINPPSVSDGFCNTLTSVYNKSYTTQMQGKMNQIKKINWAYSTNTIKNYFLSSRYESREYRI